MEIDTERLRVEDYVCLASGLVLLTSIFLPWYKSGQDWLSGWDATKLSILPMVVALIGILVVVATALGIDFAEEYGVALAACGLAALAVVIVRIIVKQGGFQPAFGIALALLGALAILGAGLVKLVRTYVIPL